MKTFKASGKLNYKREYGSIDITLNNTIKKKGQEYSIVVDVLYKLLEFDKKKVEIIIKEIK